jgi:hypothetical protein
MPATETSGIVAFGHTSTAAAPAPASTAPDAEREVVANDKLDPQKIEFSENASAFGDTVALAEGPRGQEPDGDMTDVAAAEAEIASSTLRRVSQSPTVELQAFTGEPFGVGKITVFFSEDSRPTWLPDQLISLEAARSLYPVVNVRYASASKASQWQVDRYEGYFLFQGHEPLSVGLIANATYLANVVPEDNRQNHHGLLSTWWREYCQHRSLFFSKYSESPIVKDYLQNMLARRLELSNDLPELGGGGILFPLVEWLLRPLFSSSTGQSTTSGGSVPLDSRFKGSLVFDFDKFLGLLFGTESIRIAFQTDRMLTDGHGSETADLPLPPPVSLPSLPSGEKYLATKVEPIALRVPQECFYLRCQSLGEYLWLRSLVISWGGSFNDLISTNTVDSQIRPRIERQLALSADDETQAELDQLVSDMALIGTDILFDDGAALGVLFEARDGQALERLIRRQRKKVQSDCPQAAEQEVPFGSRMARLLSTPDNRVRSFYAIDGDYHLVTTSSHIVQRFFETGTSLDALGRLDEFRHARTVMPAERGDGLFIYLSDPFFRMIVGPHYRIEMTRRQRAKRDWQQVHLARLAAQAEHVDADHLESLVQADFLPADFLNRPDGSRPILEGDKLSDSLRGAIGTFLPVPDVVVATATRSEVDSYQQFAGHYQQQWRRMDPVAIGIQHFPGREGGRQRVVLDVRITPYARENYETLYSQLDPPDQLQLAPVPGNVLSVEAKLQSFSSRWVSLQAQHPRTYAGLRDFAPAFAVENGEVRTVSLSPLSLLGQEYQVYAGAIVIGGAWSQVTGDGHSPSANIGGYSFQQKKFPVALRWRRTWNESWIAWAHSKDILEGATPYLQLERAERPAQVRFRLGDLSESQLGPTIQAICYMHARRLSALNVRQIHNMSQQFKLKPQEARRAAENLAGGNLVCPLGGEYFLTEDGGAGRTWNSTAWGCPSVYREDEVTEGYSYPFLDWLRGAVIELTLDRITLSTHVELEVKQFPMSDR